MDTENLTVNVRHRVGFPAWVVIGVTFFLDKVGIHLPMKYVTRAVNRWSYVSVDNGPWYRLPLDVPEDLV